MHPKIYLSSPLPPQKYVLECIKKRNSNSLTQPRKVMTCSHCLNFRGTGSFHGFLPFLLLPRNMYSQAYCLTNEKAMKSESLDCVITEPLLHSSSSWMAFKCPFCSVLWREALVSFGFGIHKWIDLAILKKLTRKLV